MSDQTPLQPEERPTSGADSARVVLSLVSELGRCREQLADEHKALMKERKSERRWRIVFQSLLLGGPIVIALLYVVFFSNALGLKWGPFKEVVGVVKIEGEISPTTGASAERIVPVLARAFASENVHAVVLSIDSPGGAAVEAERIADAVRNLKRKYAKPVYSVIGNVGASGAYMVALASDKIYAGRWSLVGSIGTLIAAWDLHKLPERFEVKQNVWASGNLKGLFNPFSPLSPEGDAKAKALVQTGGAAFLQELKSARGSKLRSGVDFGTGEVWAGPDAQALGLVDEIGTLDQVVEANFGLKTYDFGPSSGGFGILSGAASDFARQLARELLSIGATRMH